MHSPYGAQVHAPWALAIGVRLRERFGIDAQALPSDDGIVLRVPETDQDPPGADVVLFEPDEIEDIVTTEVGGSALFASRFRECAARALLLPRRDPGRRSPLWQQRQRSAQLLQVAVKYPSFPIVLEAVRECLQDVYDVPALVGLMRELGSRRIKVAEVSTTEPSPFARSLLFGYVAAFMYEGDSPVAERRAAALSLDQGLLAELLGRVELRELLDPDVLGEVEIELQRLTSDRQARDPEGLADLLRLLGPLTTDEVRARCVDGADVPAWLATLRDARRVVEVRMAGVERWAAVEDVARLRDGIGVPVPIGTPEAFTEPVDDPLADLVARYARTHGPFTAGRRRRAARARRRRRPRRPWPDSRPRAGCSKASSVPPARERSGATPRCCAGCDAARSRPSARRWSPSSRPPLGRFLPAWQNVSSGGGRGLRGVDGVLAVVEQLAGCACPASRSRAARARRARHRLRALDARRADRVRRGAVDGPRHASGRRRLGVAAPRGLRSPHAARPRGARHHTAARRDPRGARHGGGAYFFRQLSDAVGATDDRALTAALWDLVWASRLTNDTLAPLRALTSRRRTTHRSRRPPPRAGSRPGGVAPTCPRGPGRRRWPAAGRSSPSSSRTRLGARTPAPRPCSTVTAW